MDTNTDAVRTQHHFCDIPTRDAQPESSPDVAQNKH